MLGALDMAALKGLDITNIDQGSLGLVEKGLAFAAVDTFETHSAVYSDGLQDW